MNQTTLKPWPSDAVMVVCASPETAKREQMETIQPCNCRDCGAALVVDSYTLRRCSEPRLARGRPTKFFCVDCFRHYDFRDVTHFEDHRGRSPAGNN